MQQYQHVEVADHITKSKEQPPYSHVVFKM